MRLFTLLALASVLAAGPALAQSKLDTTAKRDVALPGASASDTAAPPIAHTGGALRFSEDFEAFSISGEGPAGWVVENSNGDERLFIAIEDAARANSGDFAAAVFWNSDAPADDWLISPPITVEGGVEHTLRFWLKPGDPGFGTAEDLEVFYGSDATSVAMLNPLVDLDGVPAGDYQEVTATFTPAASGAIHLGFHCDSAADQYFCAIDDVTVEGPTPAGPALTIRPYGFNFGEATVGGSVGQTFTYTNDGGATVNISSIQLAPPFDLGDVSGLDPVLSPGESMSFEVLFVPTEEGDATGTLLTISDAPSSADTGALSGTAIVRPPNDDVADATPLSSAGTVTGTNVNATLEAGEPDPSCASAFGSSVFWLYTSGGDGTIDVSLEGSSFDTVLSIHNPGDIAELACNDDNGGGGLWSAIDGFTVANGTALLIRVGGFGGDEGDVSLRITENFGTAISDDPDAAFGLGAPSPNPTAGTFRMDLRMASPEAVRVAVYDVLGREVAVVHDGPVAAGETALTGSMDALPAGSYLVRATGPSFVSTRSLTVIR